MKKWVTRSHGMLTDFIPKTLSACSNFGGPWEPRPMWEHVGGSVHYISLPKSANLAMSTSASQLAGWAEPSFTTSQPFWQGVAKRRRDKPTQPQMGKA